MPYNEALSERIEQYLSRKKIAFEAKKMFGGICFMVDDKMCVGVVKDELMVRANPAEAENLAQKPGARPMDFTGKRMKGFLFINDDGCDTDAGLEEWIEVCLAYNPLAKSSKKK